MLLVAAAIYLSGNYVAPVAQTTCGTGTTAVSNIDGTTTCVSDDAGGSSSPTVVITQDQTPVPVVYNSPFILGRGLYGGFHHVR